MALPSGFSRKAKPTEQVGKLRLSLAAQGGGSFSTGRLEQDVYAQRGGSGVREPDKLLTDSTALRFFEALALSDNVVNGETVPAIY